MKIKNWIKISALVALAIVAILAIRGCQSNKKAYDSTLGLLDMTDNHFRMYKTVSELNAAVARQRITGLDGLLILKSSEIERLKKELRVKPKTIKELVEIYIQGKDSVVLRKVETIVDNSTVKLWEDHYSYEDGWNKFDAYAKDGKLGLSYSITDSISIVSERVNGGLFRRGYTQVQALSYNPAVRITGLSSVAVADPKIKRWSIGPYVGYGIDSNIKPNFTVGVGVQYGLLRF